MISTTRTPGRRSSRCCRTSTPCSRHWSPPQRSPPGWNADATLSGRPRFPRRRGVPSRRRRADDRHHSDGGRRSRRAQRASPGSTGLAGRQPVHKQGSIAMAEAAMALIMQRRRGGGIGRITVSLQEAVTFTTLQTRQRQLVDLARQFRPTATSRLARARRSRPATVTGWLSPFTRPIGTGS